MKINTKIILSILSLVTVFYLIAVLYISYISRERAIRDAQTIADSEAEAFAHFVKAELNTDLGLCRSLANGFTAYDDFPTEAQMSQYSDMIHNIFKSSEGYLALWVSWELNAIDTSYKKPHGRRSQEFFLNNGNIETQYSYRDMDNPNEGSMYYEIKINPQEQITEPYYYSYISDSILEASIIAPIVHLNRFVGIVGVDVSLEEFFYLIRDVQPFRESFAFLVSNSGVIIAHPEKKFVGKNIRDIYPKTFVDNNLLTNINLGIKASVTDEVKGLKGKQYISLAPFKIGESNIPWSVGIVVPENVIVEEGVKAFRIALIVGSIGLVLLVILISFIMNRITSPVVEGTAILNKIKDGIVNENLKIKRSAKDEFGDISVAINDVIDVLSDIVKYAHEIGRGNLNVEFKLRSENDMLGSAILDMRKNLISVKEEEAKRKKEQEIRNWVSVGSAKISNIIQTNYTSLDQMAKQTISNLVKYIDAATGAIYITNNDDSKNIFLEQLGTFAYERTENKKLTFSTEEGILGKCYKTKSTIVVDSISENYIRVKSGLGASPPKTLVLIPIVNIDNVLGVIEISTFRDLKDYEFEFLEGLAKSLANATTNFLHSKERDFLLKQFEEQTEILQKNEQKSLKSFHEIEKLQQETAIREAELGSLFSAIKNSVYVVIYNSEGVIIDVNQKLLDLLSIEESMILGTKQGDFVVNKNVKKQTELVWKNVIENQIVGEIVQEVHIKDKKLWLASVFSPIVNEKGETIKILNISQDITKQMK
ncbi:MAG: GAF domain-containing protein [Bacteroidales bacterium]|nr:GAF domain-containing protein [Bacteroidales bacterium]